MRRPPRLLAPEGADSRRPAAGRGGAKRLATFALTLAVLAGCGVAQETGVVQDEKVAQKGVRGRNSEQRFPPERGATSDPKQFVLNYLHAAAGDDTTKAADRLRQYFTPEAASSWQPTNPEVQVVRLLGGPNLQRQGDVVSAVTVRLQLVGILTDRGTVEARQSWKEINPSFDVRSATPAEPDQRVQRGLFMAGAPASVYLLDSALTEFYIPYSIYFWDNGNRTLVPDRRYLPASVAEQGRPTVVVRWLLAGPSQLISPTMDGRGLPSGTSLLRDVYTENGALVVNLSAKAIEKPTDAAETDRLMAQLRWSLWDLYSGPIKLLIGGQPKAVDDSTDKYRHVNRAAALPSVPDWFCVAGGRILASCQTVPPGLDVPENAGVVSAAIARDDQSTRVAMVKGTSGRTLSVLQVGKNGAKPTVQDVLSRQTMSRPVWLGPTSPPTVHGLVAADGELYRITVDSGVHAEQLQVETTGGTMGPITAVAAAPDARRIALIAGGRLWVAPLIVAGKTIRVGTALPRLTTPTSLSAVAFSAQDRILVAGRENNQGWLVELGIDGATQTKRDLSEVNVTELAAYPEDPAARATRGSVMVEANGRGSTVFANSLSDIAAPSPSASPGTGTVRATAPFYVD